MTSSDYDEYVVYLRNVSDEELYYETEDTFAQIGDEDEGIKYTLCIAEERSRHVRLAR